MNTIIIFLFGALGGITRFAIGEMIPKLNGFPFATLLINLVGCFFLPFLVKYYLVAKRIPSKIILGIGTGFIGSFTTFSSLMLDSIQLIQSKNYVFLLCYLMLSMLGGLCMTRIGIAHGRRWVSE
ncbi:CrcB protein [Pilibacter termitis]|jgi:CrcB protein|uniref:Fluoride-specific ion channel FluC n=1 Tax=Pilibacter termitis TaxID=263852 RepID=A0A1T4QSG7_9ENTE|nr:CrcB family protein [Pilibacter termitis]SKA06616.1 CrcB protein [Pilibacter termitis]